ncbi:MAG TPA: D-sedoheptulose 7-phosphate isomerase [bacterium]
MSHVVNDFSSRLRATIEESIEAKKRVATEHVAVLNKITQALHGSLFAGHKVLLFGNGGSAADSQHIAAELVSKFFRDRKALPAIALTTDTSILTSIANDYSYEDVFARQIEALGEKGDVAIGISTSGNSPNVLKAMNIARNKGLITIGLTGQDGGKLQEVVDICFHAPSKSTPRIQEIHITVAHAICDIIEQELG